MNFPELQKQIDKLPIAQQVEAFATMVDDVCNLFVVCVAVGNTVCLAGLADVTTLEQDEIMKAAFAKLYATIAPVISHWKDGVGTN